MHKVVLFVDPSVSQLNEYAWRFEADWRIECVRSPWMSLYFISKNQVDLVVTEVNFADMNFDDFLRQARDHRPGLSFLIVSNRHHPCSLLQLRKPVDYLELKRTIESVLARR